VQEVLPWMLVAIIVSVVTYLMFGSWVIMTMKHFKQSERKRKSKWAL